MKDMPVAYSQPASWYVRGDYSYSWMDAGDLRGADHALRHRLDRQHLGGRRRHRPLLRPRRARRRHLRVARQHRRAQRRAGRAPPTSTSRARCCSANLYYDFRPYERFTPYVGVGLGAAHHRTSGGSSSHGAAARLIQAYDGDSNWSAAGALMAGFSFRIDRGDHAPVSIKDGRAYVEPGRLHLDVGYRFLYLGDAHTGKLIGVAPPTPGPRLDDVTAHEIRVGLRWDIR